MRLLGALFRKLIRKGTLIVVDADGQRHSFGDGSDIAPPVTIRFTDRATLRRAAVNAALELGEAYVDGRLLIRRRAMGDSLRTPAMRGRSQ